MNEDLSGGRAIQDLVRGTCFGCGCENEQGLQIKSYWDGEEATCVWTPESYHCGGPGFLYGGMIASLIDCHSCMTAVAAAYDGEGRGIGLAPEIWFVTASLNITYKKPSPIESPVMLRSRVLSVDGRKTRVGCSLLAEDVERSVGEGLFIRVK